MSKMGLALAIMCASFTGGCDIFETTLKAVGAQDSIGDMKQGLVTPPTADVPASPVVVPEPPCEDIRWRYVVYDCHWNPIGTYGE